MKAVMIYNGYPIYFRPLPGLSEYFVTLTDGTEVSHTILTELWKIINADIKKG